METRVNEGIEKYRKGDFSISFVDKEGKPVKDVTVRAELTNHAISCGMQTGAVGNIY